MENDGDNFGEDPIALALWSEREGEKSEATRFALPTRARPLWTSVATCVIDAGRVRRRRGPTSCVTVRYGLSTASGVPTS